MTILKLVSTNDPETLKVKTKIIAMRLKLTLAIIEDILNERIN